MGCFMSNDLLILAQWLSPSFPVGAFAYSHGLEHAVCAGRVRNSEELRLWLSGVLRHGSGWSDVVFLATAYSANDEADLGLVDEMARAFQSSAERSRESERMGAAFARTVRDVWELDIPDLMYPVAVGRAARLKSVGLQETNSLYLHSFAANMVSAAVRLVPLGQTEGQAVLAALGPICTTLAEQAEMATLDDLSNVAIMSDISAMRHETQEPRLFQS